APTKSEPSELVADKGYHSRAVLKELDGGLWKTRIAEPKQPGFSRWHGDDKARAAVYANRTRLGSGSASRRCGGGRKSSSDPLPTISTEAACAGPGCAVARTFTNVIWSTSPDTISAS